MAQPPIPVFCTEYQYHLLSLQKLHAEGRPDNDVVVMELNHKFSTLFATASDEALEAAAASGKIFVGMFADLNDEKRIAALFRFLKRMRYIHQDLLAENQTRALPVAA